MGRAGVSALLASGNWLTSIVAGAGAGKTTSTGGWATGRPVAWVPLDPDCADLGVFLSGLADAISRAPGAAAFAGPIREALASRAGDPHVRADELASLVAGTLDGGRSGIAIVLDGFEHLPGSCPPVRFVEALARHAPGGTRLLILTRDPLPFPVDRLRSSGQLSEIAAEDLVFGVDETYQLLTIALGDAAAADQIAGDLHTLTGGWPGQVSLAAAWLAQQEPSVRHSRLASLEGFDGHVAQAVLTNAGPDTRDVIRLAAYLPRVDARLLISLGDRLPGGTSAGGGARSDADVRAALARSAPMLMPESGRPGWFRASASARAAVRASDPLVPLHRGQLLRDAAEWYAENGELVDAINAAVMLGDPGVLTAILEAHGAELILAGRSGDVVSAVDAIPADARTPQILLVNAEARHSRGDVPGALASLDRLRATHPPGSPLSASDARRIGKIRQHAGDLAGAAEEYARARRDGRQPIDEAILAGQVASLHWLRGDVDLARAASAEAMALATACADPRALAGAHAAAAMVAERDGDLGTAASHARHAAAAAEVGGDLVQLIRVRINSSQRLIQSGSFAPALVELDDVLRLTELSGTSGWFGALVRTNRGWAYRGLGRLEEAVAEFNAAKDFWLGTGSNLVAYARIGLGAVYLDRGNLDAADAELTEALAIGERSGDHQALTGLSTLARVRYATDPAAAWSFAERALESDTGNWRTWALLTAGWLALCDGDPARALDHAAEAERHLGTFPDTGAAAEAVELRAHAHPDYSAAIVLLADAKERWTRIGNPIRVNQVTVSLAHRSGSPSGPAEATLRAFGVLPTAAWAAGSLRIAGAFRSALSVAGWTRFVGAARAAILAVGDAPFGGADAVAARGRLTDALALLPVGRPAGSARPGQQDHAGSEVRSAYLDVLATLAQICEQTGDVDGALAWNLRLLEDDPFDEHGHLGVVTTLARAGRDSEARRRYRMYTERMRQGSREPAPYPANRVV